MSTANARLEYRVSPATRALIERAAEIAGMQPTSFARMAAEERAAQIVREHDATTVVSPAYFDDLLAALDEPTQPNAKLAAAFAKVRATATRE
jgi:uncharacterized protein (DUF1778 family)